MVFDDIRISTTPGDLKDNIDCKAVYQCTKLTRRNHNVLDAAWSARDEILNDPDENGNVPVFRVIQVPKTAPSVQVSLVKKIGLYPIVLRTAHLFQQWLGHEMILIMGWAFTTAIYRYMDRAPASIEQLMWLLQSFFYHMDKKFLAVTSCLSLLGILPLRCLFPVGVARIPLIAQLILYTHIILKYQQTKNGYDILSSFLMSFLMIWMELVAGWRYHVWQTFNSAQVFLALMTIITVVGNFLGRNLEFIERARNFHVIVSHVHNVYGEMRVFPWIMQLLQHRMAQALPGSTPVRQQKIPWSDTRKKLRTLVEQAFQFSYRVFVQDYPASTDLLIVPVRTLYFCPR